MKRLLPLLAVLPLAAPLSAQIGTVNGSVTAAGVPLSGAQVVMVQAVTGAQYGGITNDNGRYAVSGVPAGTYDVSVQLIGYTSQNRQVSVASGGTASANFDMVASAVSIGSIEVLAERAEARRTPVAFTDIPRVQIQSQLGSRDLPLILNLTPSVYSTPQGGGAGDARINVRGFSQRNTAVMINGVPVNDMENGWVYWSNWDGLGDATTSIQLQRGLSAVNLATPSIGGTLNVITDPSAQDPGYTLKQEFGSGNFRKTTMTASTGSIGNLAITGSAVRKQGDGIIDGTWTDAWAYYLATQYRFNASNRLELFAVGAPQRHGQNLYRLNIATIDRDFAFSLDDYDREGLARFRSEAGRYWSPNVAGVDPSYTGRQFTSTGPGAGVFSRHNRSFINERENYFHKPQINLNWYSYLGDGLTANTVMYYSGGRGGGTGTFGSLVWDYTYGQRFANWDATISRNGGSNTGSRGILRNSVNNQDTYGLIAKLHKVFGSIVTEAGVDWRTATIEHYREVRDLLGGLYYRCRGYCGSDFWSETEENRLLGDKIHYHNENDVNWLGAHVQAEQSSAAGSYYGMLGVSRISYDFTDFFTRAPSGGLLELSSGGLTGYQVKGGAMRNVSSSWSVFGNAGWVSKVPIFDGVIDDNRGILNPNPKNETFLSFEAGTRFRAVNRKVSLDANFYFTQWNNRTRNQFIRNLLGDNQDGLVNLLGVNARHMGVEMKGAFQPTDFLRFEGALSYGDWKYTNDPAGTFKPDDLSGETEEYTFFLDGLYVGDAPQFQVAYSMSLYPTGGFSIETVGRTYDKHYADYSPFDRTTNIDAGVQSWSPPGYTVFDLHMKYTLPGEMAAAVGGGEMRLFLNAFNIFDAIYVQDARDNSRWNGYESQAEDDRGMLSHKADDAEVFLGYPRSFNFGFQIAAGRR